MVNTITFSQNDELHFLKGKIICQSVDLTTIIVENKRSKNAVNPEKNGDFSMFVKLGDKLVFQGLVIDTKEIEITKEDLAKKLLTITVFAKIIPLDDVEIKTYPNINAVSLGILQKPAKTYTPAERRLKTASDYDPYFLVGLGGGVGFGLDPILNVISGRTAMLKKELKIEKKEFVIKKIQNQFEENYFTDTLKIPTDYVQAFIYYISDNDELKNALVLKNKVKTEFALAKLATEFLELQKEK